jgi:GrpB-like predicted nucleotidyltransferase (UPF0157 family)
MDDNIFIADYDPSWPHLFEIEAAQIHEALGNLILAIEHFGSTAVPGLAAKPIIDILVGVPSLSESSPVLVSNLEALGYRYWCDNPDPARMFFVKGLPPNGPRTHHVHIVEPHREQWERLLFRDYLRQYPEEAERYAQLKRDLAQQFQVDREAYTAGKTEYVQSVILKAKQEFAVIGAWVDVKPAIAITAPNQQNQENSIEPPPKDSN